MELGSSHIQQSTIFTPKNELLQDQNFNYRISKAFILKLTNIAASCLPMDKNKKSKHYQKIYIYIYIYILARTEKEN